MIDIEIEWMKGKRKKKNTLKEYKARKVVMNCVLPREHEHRYKHGE